MLNDGHTEIMKEYLKSFNFIRTFILWVSVYFRLIISFFNSCVIWNRYTYCSFKENLVWRSALLILPLPASLFVEFFIFIRFINFDLHIITYSIMVLSWLSRSNSNTLKWIRYRIPISNNMNTIYFIEKQWFSTYVTSRGVPHLSD